MSDKASRWCVFLPCSEEEVWAIPQNCLAEIVTLHDAGEYPPEQIMWRGREVPVMDLGDSGETPWRDPAGKTGLVAVILGLQGQGSEYWAVALRGDGLAVRDLGTERLRDAPDRILERSTSAFTLQDAVYQVPDLQELQKQVAMFRASA